VKKLGTDIWVIDAKKIYSSLSQEEVMFIVEHFYPSDEVLYCVDDEELEELKKELPKEELEKFKGLMRALEEACKDGGISISLW
jgi:hypothetical protein